MLQAPEADRFDLTGEFRDVGPPARLAYTVIWPQPDPDDVENQASFSLRDLGESSDVAFTQGPFKTRG